MVASGRIPVAAYPQGYMDKGLIGMEFAGTLAGDKTGRRVMGFTGSKSVATTVELTNRNFIWQVPEKWSLSDAATVPLAYVTAYYALYVRGEMRPGETVLIHAGAGAVGQAAINVCLGGGCRVYVTCGSKSKRDFLKTEFGLTDDDIFVKNLFLRQTVDEA